MTGEACARCGHAPGWHEGDVGPCACLTCSALARRCPRCNRVMFRTMTDYLCLGGCGHHERHHEPIPTPEETA